MAPTSKPEPIVCPHCQNDDPRLMELTRYINPVNDKLIYYCGVCTKTFTV